MKNIYDVLQEKEAEIQRLKEELRALSIVAPLLEEGAGQEPEVTSSSVPDSERDLLHRLRGVLAHDPSANIASPAGETGDASGDPPRPSPKPTRGWGRLNPPQTALATQTKDTITL